MMQIAQRLQSYYVINHNYTNATLDNGTVSKAYPASILYIPSPGPEWSNLTLTAEPKSGTVQDGNGAVVLNSQGQNVGRKTTAVFLLLQIGKVVNSRFQVSQKSIPRCSFCKKFKTVDKQIILPFSIKLT